jgi:hypothetical protein
VQSTCPCCGSRLSAHWLAKLEATPPRWGYQVAHLGQGQVQKRGDLGVRETPPHVVERLFPGWRQRLVARLSQLVADLRAASGA